MTRQRLVWVVGVALALVVGAAAFFMTLRPDPATRIRLGMTMAEVEAALGGPSFIYTETRVGRAMEGGRVTHFEYAWRFGDKFLDVEFKARANESGHAEPDTTTGRTRWYEETRRLTFFDRLRAWLGW